MNNQTKHIIEKLQELGDPGIAAHSQRFFKTGKGEYGEGDSFLGIRVPVLRKCAKEFRETGLKGTLELLESPYHEARLLALFMLVALYENAAADKKKSIYRAYLGHTDFINNWDLVDCSAAQVVGDYLFSRDRKPIYRLAGSNSLWERRISIMATFHFVKKRDFTDTLAVAQLLLRDSEDLIHKAVGWMLREVGNRDQKVEKEFLASRYQEMPRTMLRYAIEKFPESERQEYLRGLKKKI